MHIVGTNATEFHVSVHRKSIFPCLGISHCSFCAHKFAPTGTTCTEIQYLRILFFDNGFPMKLFHSSLARFLSDKFSGNSDVPRETQQILAVFQYFGHQTQKKNARKINYCLPFKYYV